MTKNKDELEREKLQAEILTFRATESLRNAQAAETLLKVENYEREIQWDRDGNAAHRTYHFLGPVREDAVLSAANTINVWARQSNAPITIVLNSPGGSVFAGFALIDAIQAVQAQGVEVTCIVRGMAASMGGIILQVADKRIVGPHAHILIHELSTANVGKMSELEDEVEFMKRIEKQLLEILAEKSTLTVREIRRKWARKDWWLDADEAVRLGFADVIG